MDILQVHVFYEGRSYDVEASAIDIGDISPDADVRRAIASHIGAAVGKLDAFRVERTDGNITLHPEAVFG